MIKTICKLFYRMDMFYLIINNKTTFYLKRWALGGGGLAYIYIYIYKPYMGMVWDKFISKSFKNPAHQMRLFYSCSAGDPVNTKNLLESTDAWNR